jgi:aspartate aminotransferase-like enzyme
MLNSLQAIGLEIFPKVPAKSMAAVYFEKAEELRKILKTKYQINVAGGQDFMKGKLFRINNMGLIEENKMEYILNSIELALEELKIRRYDAEAVRVYNQRK